MDVLEGARGILEDLLAGVGALSGSVALGVALNLIRRNNKIARESRRKNRGK